MKFFPETLKKSFLKLNLQQIYKAHIEMWLSSSDVFLSLSQPSSHRRLYKHLAPSQHIDALAWGEREFTRRLSVCSRQNYTIFSSFSQRHRAELDDCVLSLFYCFLECCRIFNNFCFVYFLPRHVAFLSTKSWRGLKFQHIIICERFWI